MTAQTFEPIAARPAPNSTEGPIAWIRINLFGDWVTGLMTICLLYTSDAADERSSVDLGGRRIFKKKRKKKKKNERRYE